jgi:hypothetical protein
MFPKHVQLEIRHNPHVAEYMTVAEWLKVAQQILNVDLPEESVAAMIAADEIWIIQWYPETPVGSCVVYGPSWESVLALANSD